MRILGLLVVLQFQTITSAVQATDNSSSVALDKLVVVGQVSGPDLWKVTDGEHVLWILGTLSPLPKRLDWNSKPIEQVIQSSQAFLLPTEVTTDLGFFQKISLVTAAVGIKKNPRKQKLKDVLPAELYARWLVMKTKFMGDDRGIEKTRPIYASQKLFAKALKETGLTSNIGITKKLMKVAKKNDIAVIQPELKIVLNEPKTALKKFKKSQLNDIECFTKTIQRIETDLDAMRLRAIAWSYGDIETIKSLPYADDNRACGAAVLNSELARNMGVTDIRVRLRAVWLDAVKTAMSQNKSSFAVWPISQLLSDDSILLDLESAGYEIQAPGSTNKR